MPFALSRNLTQNNYGNPYQPLTASCSTSTRRICCGLLSLPRFAVQCIMSITSVTTDVISWGVLTAVTGSIQPEFRGLLIFAPLLPFDQTSLYSLQLSISDCTSCTKHQGAPACNLHCTSWSSTKKFFVQAALAWCLLTAVHVCSNNIKPLLSLPSSAVCCREYMSGLTTCFPCCCCCSTLQYAHRPLLTSTAHDYQLRFDGAHYASCE